MGRHTELRLSAEDPSLVPDIVRDEAMPVFADLVDDPREWPRRHRNNSTMCADEILEHIGAFIERITFHFDELSRDSLPLTGEIAELMETFAGLPRDADDLHRVVFWPLSQLAPLSMLARRAARDTWVRIHSAEFVIEHRRKSGAKDGVLPWVYSNLGYGGRANVIALVVNGLIQGVGGGGFRPFTAAVNARPLMRMGGESDDAMIARHARDMLTDFREVIRRLAAARETSAAMTLQQMPFIVSHQDYGAPLRRGERPPVASHFTPGTSYALMATLARAGRPVAATIDPRRGLEARNTAQGRLRYETQGGRPLDQRELVRRADELARTGALDRRFARRLERGLNARILPTAPGGVPLVHLLGRLQLTGDGVHGAVPVAGHGLLRLEPMSDAQVWMLRVPRGHSYATTLDAIQRRQAIEARLAHERCIARWRERAAALFVLHGRGATSLRAGIEAVMEVANLVYVFAALGGRY